MGSRSLEVAGGLQTERVLALECSSDWCDSNARLAEPAGLHDLVKLLPVPAVVIHRSDGTIRLANRAALNRTDLKLNEASGAFDGGLWGDLSRRDILVEKLDTDGVVENFDAVLDGGAAGEKLNVVISARRTAYQGQAAYLVIFNDVEARARAERHSFQEGGDPATKTASSEQGDHLSADNMKAIINAKAQGIVVHRDHETLFINDEAVRLLPIDHDVPESSSGIPALFSKANREELGDLHNAFDWDNDGVLEFTLEATGDRGELVLLGCKSQLVDWDDGPAFLTFIAHPTEKSPREKALEETVANLEGQVEHHREALLPHDQMFQAFIEDAPSAISLKEEDGTILHINKMGRNLFLNSKHSEIKGEDFYELFHLPQAGHGDTARILKEADELVFKTGEPVGVKDEIIFHERGRSYKVIKFPVRNQNGVIDKVGAMSFDVTEELVARKKLADTAESLQKILETSPVGVSISTRSDGSIKFANTRQLEILGATPEQAFGAPTERYWVNPEDRQSLVDQLAAHGQADGTFELRKHDGTPMWCVHSWREMPDAPDDVLVWIYDVTDLKEAQANLLTAKEEAEDANQAKSKFLSSMSHELRTPLNAILGFSQLLEIDTAPPLSEQQLLNVNQVTKSGTHLLALINQMLDLTGIEEGRLKLNHEKVGTGRILGECMELAAPLARESNIDFQLNLQGHDSLEIYVDPVRLKQVLLNLIGNAVKYNKDTAGAVWVRVETRGDSDAFIFVTDTGIGIPPEFHDRVFTPFERLGREAGAVEGTGIGLAIAKQTIEAMNGSIGFTSEPGAGSEFWISVPLAKP